MTDSTPSTASIPRLPTTSVRDQALTLARDRAFARACQHATEVRTSTFAELTTLRIGGSPRAVLACTSAKSLARVVALLDAGSVPFLVVGGGSNLVVGEEVSDLTVVLACTEGAEAASPDAIEIDPTTGIVRAYAGVVWDDLVRATVDAGLGGLECLSGIPGSVGATPVQNVGAYGAEVSQTLRRVELYERDPATPADALTTPLPDAGSVPAPRRWVDPAELELGYRYSNLKFTQRAVVTAVEFQLRTDGLSVPLRYGELARRLGVDEAEVSAADGEVRRPVADVRAAVLELRAGKGMVLDAEDHDTWSAGSFFTNPIVEGEQARDAVIAAARELCGEEVAAAMPIYAAGRSAVADEAATATTATGAQRFKFSAAWLIDHAGFAKGWSLPGHPEASLSTKHTLALTNRGGATSEDIARLARAVRDGVRERMGVELEPEPIWVGMSLDNPAT